MKISELLYEAELPGKKPANPFPSKLPSAPSLDDEPVDDEDDGEEDETEDNSGDIEKLKKVAGDIGDDLYSVTVYNTADDFADIKPITKPQWTLEDFNSPVVSDYLAQNKHDISNDKTISCVIFNARNGEFFRFDSGMSGSGFEPNLQSLVAQGVIEPDQVSVLRDIDSAGKKYNAALQRVNWKAGNEAEGRGAGAMYNALSLLKDRLNLREFVERINDVEISDEQRAKNSEYSDRARKLAKEKMAAFRAAKAAGGPGRDKR